MMFVLKTSICLLILKVVIVTSVGYDYFFNTDDGKPLQNPVNYDPIVYKPEKPSNDYWTWNLNDKTPGIDPVEYDHDNSENYDSFEDEDKATEEYDSTTTTEASTTTEIPNTNCPPNLTKFAENDLKEIIDSFINDKNVTEVIKSSYHTKAVEIKDKHLKALESFMEKFRNRPKHLKHILDAIAKNRQNLEPAVNKLVNYLEKYPTLEKNYNTTLAQKIKLQEQYDKIKKICDLNCGKKKSNSALGMFLGENYYCGTYSGLTKRIKGYLEEFTGIARKNMSDKLSANNLEYKMKIENITKDLKDHAIKEFGVVMFDVLNLQDDYYHFEELIKNNCTERAFYGIERNNGNSNIQILELQRKLPVFKKYCLNCNSSSKTMLLPLAYKLRKAVNDQKDIVDILLGEKANEIINITVTDYNCIFEDLNKKINESASVEKIMQDIEPIKQEIEDLNAKEQQELLNLKQKASNNSVKPMADLYTKSEQLLSSLQHINDELKYVYHIN